MSTSRERVRSSVEGNHMGRRGQGAAACCMASINQPGKGGPCLAVFGNTVYDRKRSVYPVQ